MERFLDFHFEKETKLWPLFLNQSFRAVAVSLLYLFSTIYIYRLMFGLTGQSQLAILSVLAYLLGAHIFKLISNLLAEEWSLRLGLKKQVYFGLFFLALSSLALILSSSCPVWLVLASPLWGFSVGFYWFGRHGLMAKIGRDGAFGQESAMVETISTFLLLGVPFFGGILINLAGYQALFSASLVFVVLAALAVGPLPEEKTHQDTSLKEVFGLFKAHRRSFLAYLGNSAAGTMYGVVLPLWLFLILRKELSLGEFFSFSMILVALINLLVGRWVDLKGKGGLIAYGSILQFLVWLGRTLTRSVSVLFAFDIIDRVAGGMVGIPLNVLSYEKALDGHGTGRAVLFRETAISLGSILADCFLLVLIASGGRLPSAFWAAAFFSLFPLLLVKGKEKNFWSQLFFWRRTRP